MVYKNIVLDLNGYTVGNFKNVEIEINEEEILTVHHDYDFIYSVYIYHNGSLIFCVSSCLDARLIGDVLYIAN